MFNFDFSIEKTKKSVAPELILALHLLGYLDRAANGCIPADQLLPK